MQLGARKVGSTLNLNTNRNEQLELSAGSVCRGFFSKFISRPAFKENIMSIVSIQEEG
jgi:hypothetical protein